jgi:uncharacterized protein YndB with AHSA1/START domain
MNVERSVVLTAPRAEVWRALVDERALSDWFGASVRVDRLERGGRLEFSWDDGVTRGAVIEEVVPERTLAFRWLPFERRPEGAFRRETTRVVLSLEDGANGTSLHVVESEPLRFGFVAAGMAPVGIGGVR